MKPAFTLVELVFVIVILGILASVAIPRMTATRTDGIVTKGRSEVASIRSAILTARQENLLQGNNACPAIDSNTTNSLLFEGLLEYPIRDEAGSGHWSEVSATTFNFNVDGTNELFTYLPNVADRCQFDCDHNNDLCRDLTE
jgi:general secretion pathway protein G